MPEWINFKLDTSKSLSEIIDHFSKGAKRDIKMIKKYEYSYEVSTDPKKLDFFYNRMFLPYISQKYGELVPFSYFLYIKNLLDRVSVLLIKYKDKYVCGGLIDSKKNVVTLPSMGILDGEAEYLKKGVVVALFYYHILYAKEAGFNILDYGIKKSGE
jgi:hypothetical protein